MKKLTSTSPIIVLFTLLLFTFSMGKVFANPIIVAGTGQSGFSGDNGLATAARLSAPTDVVLGSDGNMYIADGRYPRIRKVDTSGIITTIAGTGESGFNGDNIPATSAMLDGGGQTLAIDDNNNLYLTDGARVRKIDSSGIITTVAGTGSWAGELTADSGIATDVPLTWVKDITVDPDGNLYILNEQHILKVTPSGLFTRIAGNYSGQQINSGDNGPAIDADLASPDTIDFGGDGNLYVGGSTYIRKIDSAGTITKINEGTIINSGGRSIAVADNGDVYFSDYLNRLQKINAAGVTVRVKVGSVSDTYRRISINNGDLYLADFMTHTIRKFEAESLIPKIIPVYRLYLHARGEHLFTRSELEYNLLGSRGWTGENIPFYVYDQPEIVEDQTSIPWLRLYNRDTDLHHWTTLRAEYDFLGANSSWIKEGVTGYLFENQVSLSVPLFRLYNPNSYAHHFTINVNEKNTLVTLLGWKDEGIAGYVYQSSQ